MKIDAHHLAPLLLLLGAAACGGESTEDGTEPVNSVAPSTSTPAASSSLPAMPVASLPAESTVPSGPAQTSPMPSASSPATVAPSGTIPPAPTSPSSGPSATTPAPAVTTPPADPTTTPAPDVTGEPPGPAQTMPTPVEPEPTEPVEMLSEAVQFYMDFCARCHGDTGQGVDGLGPAVQHPVREFGDYVVRNGRSHEDYPEDMPAIAEDALSDELLSEIWDYLDEPPQPTDGEGLYADYCKNCHGDDGDAVPNHGISGMEANADSYIDNARSGHHRGEFDNRGGYMPAFEAEMLSDEELTLIAEYVASL